MDVLRRNNVTVSGDGPSTMVLAHGYGCDQTMWNLVAPHFAKTHRVVAFDYVGCGQSDLSAFDPNRYASLRGYAQDVVEICDALDITNATFVGHSVSSMVGLLAAKERPERIHDLVMLCPSPRYINEPDFPWGFDQEAISGLLDMIESGQTGWTSFLAGLVVNNDTRGDLTTQFDETFCALDPDVARRFAETTFCSDNRADLDGFDAPCLIVQCRDDIVASPVVGEYVHRHLANSTLTMLEVAGHCPHLSHPTETIAAIDSFLAAA